MRVWVTRDETSDGPLSAALRRAGLEVVHEPVLARHVREDARPIVSQLSGDDWLVLTSAYAVEAVAASTANRAPSVAVVGEPSRRAAISAGFRVELVSKDSDAGSLFAEMKERVSCGKLCYPRSSLAKPPEPWGKTQLLSPVLYETTPRAFDRGVVDRIDVVAVVSPSAIEAIRDAGLNLRDLRFASIGPTTSAALRELGIEPVVEAPERSFESLAQAVASV